MQQNDFMAFLYFISGENDEFTTKAYADAEAKGLVDRDRNTHSMSSEEYARRLLYNGKNRGWLNEKTQELRKTFPNNRLHSIADAVRSE